MRKKLLQTIQDRVKDLFKTGYPLFVIVNLIIMPDIWLRVMVSKERVESIVIRNASHPDPDKFFI